MKLTLGDRAGLTRVFTADDLHRFSALTGGPVPDSVPEPLIAALFSTLLGMHLPGPGTGWLKQDLTHLRPVATGDRLHASVTLTRLRPEKRLADLDCLCLDAAQRRICHGRALMLLPPDCTIVTGNS